MFALGIITYFVPCYTAGKNAEAIGEQCLLHAIFAIIPIVGIYCHAVIRGKIREKKNIEVRCMCGKGEGERGAMTVCMNGCVGVHS